MRHNNLLPPSNILNAYEPIIDTDDTRIERERLVSSARDFWVSRLIDETRRNNLLYFRDLKVGSLDLSNAPEEAVQRLLSGEKVAVSELALNAGEKPAPDSAVYIGRVAAANFEEKGISTLFLARGMATWDETDGGSDPSSAVVLYPIRIERPARDTQQATLRIVGDLQINLALVQYLNNQFRAELSLSHLLLGAAETDSDSNDSDQPLAPAGYAQIKDRLLDKCDQISGFAITDRLMLGNFAYQKMAMVTDLLQNTLRLVDHDLIAALAGDQFAIRKMRSAQIASNPREFDKMPPDREFLILDADSSQQQVVAAALTGQHVLVQGPPGTGKSQTIANLISTLVASGKAVLFVAEKRAALQVVLQRLTDAGLGSLCLDMHGADMSRREMIKRLAVAREAVRHAPLPDSAALHKEFQAARSQLVAHEQRVHEINPITEMSLYEMQGLLLRLPDNARTDCRWFGSELAKLTPAAIAEVEVLLRELAGMSDLIQGNKSPWADANLNSGDEVQALLATLREIVSVHLPSFQRMLLHFCDELSIESPHSFGMTMEMIMVAGQIRDLHSEFSPQLFEYASQDTVSALSPASHGSLFSLWANLTSNSYREARKMVASFALRPTRRSDKELLHALVSAYEWKRCWTRFSPFAVPRASEHWDKMSQTCDRLSKPLLDLAKVFPDRQVMGVSLDELARFLESLNSSSMSAFRIPRLNHIRRRIDDLGAGKILGAINDVVAPEQWPAILQYAWVASAYEAALSKNYELAGFHSEMHHQTVAKFIRTDIERLSIASARVRRSHAEHAIGVFNRESDQLALLDRELSKSIRHRSLRSLISEAPDALLALCPCWMASPLSVSQLLPADKRYFDVVIFDEASQVLPEDAIPAIMRAKSVVVAGDRYQLPPTRFFADGSGALGGDGLDGDDDASESEGFESLLDILTGALGVDNTRILEWHYRSADERLISFSNQEIYGNRLVTFPGFAQHAPISHVLVQPESTDVYPEDSPSAEVRTVVNLILDHARNHPEQSLGVITMGIKHARRIETLLDHELGALPELALYFEESQGAGASRSFFIKNLERVQGDERDVIILSLGYGKSASGQLRYYFGPLLVAGGERRLNVAVTRARNRMTLVSSFSHLDMDPARSASRGVQLLRAYLEYAATAGRAAPIIASASDFGVNAFEADVQDALEKRDLRLVPQWGASGYRIDFAVRHPHKPGQFVLAIECDGAQYHSSATARDRDRLRQAQLERVGWRFHRVWSTSWFLHREEEIERAFKAYEDAIAATEQEGLVSEAEYKSIAGLSQALAEDTDLKASQRLLPRPLIPLRSSIDSYPDSEIDALQSWLQSDGILRTDDEMISLLVDELGFARRGSRLVAVLQEAITRWRAKAIQLRT